ncbi:hypothetical protein B0H11DRAFT_1993994 [Mycena galericulata]|nr:hypothetical protein B0H11DRAFT_1993994 [Mycena galericulata]
MFHYSKYHVWRSLQWERAQRLAGCLINVRLTAVLAANLLDTQSVTSARTHRLHRAVLPSLISSGFLLTGCYPMTTKF